MFFRFFTLSANTEKDILKAGFSVNSYEEVNVYNGDKLEFTTQTPKDYLFKEDVWSVIDSSDVFEQSCVLAKTPYLSFDELWELLLYADQEDDRMGALVFMQKRYSQQLRQEQKALQGKKNDISKYEKRAMKMLSRMM